MPIRHVATFTFLPGTPADSAERLSHALDALSESCAGVLTYEHGPSLGLQVGNADYAIAAVFEDAGSFEAYMSAPQHQTLVEGLLGSMLATKSVVQFESGS